MKKYILALDQGTTSSRAIVFNRDGAIVAESRMEFALNYPQPGWVECDPEILWDTLNLSMKKVLDPIPIDEIEAIGITNQRESTLLWDRDTGKALHPAIIWQCRRSAPICEELKEKGLSEYIHQTTGLFLDAYFSATKIKWIFDRYPDLYKKALAGEVCFGTVDSWILWKMTNGRIHATDITNASRTMLYDIRKFCWDPFLLDQLSIPISILPEVKDTSGYFAECDIQGVHIPITAVAGDQQAALFGQTCFQEGEIKNTYGTGCFLLCNTGDAIFTEEGLISTIAWKVDKELVYALEGSVFNGGAAVQWLRDEMRLIDHADESAVIASTVQDSGGVFFVPAFTGLGAPYWDMYAKGILTGIIRNTSRAHLVRAVLESIAYRSEDIIRRMKTVSGMNITRIYADGGASANKFLMQFQADLSGLPVCRSKITESTALGAAFLAGMATGFWNRHEMKNINRSHELFTPNKTQAWREDQYMQWQHAVKCSRYQGKDHESV
jgi:glycerol kinase